MSVQAKLVASQRSELGTAACRRLRRQGVIPGNLYGHGVQPISISLSADEALPLIHSGAQVVKVELAGESETAVVREVQWDTYSMHIQHLDLVRVDANERVAVEVVIELRGIAKGVTGGGVMDQPLHSVRIDCLAVDIPDKILVRIGNLDIDQVIHVGELEIAEGVTVLTDSETVVVRVSRPVEVEESDELEAGPAEPEVIGRKADEAESTESP